MSERLRPVLVLILALAAAFLTYRLLAGLRETTTVVAAATDIAAGTTIDSSMLTTLTVSVREPKLLVSTAIHDASQVIGRAPKRAIRTGTVLKLDQDDFFLTDEAMKEATGGAVPPAYLIPQGYVAIAVPVEADSAVGFSLRKAAVPGGWTEGQPFYLATVHGMTNPVRLMEPPLVCPVANASGLCHGSGCVPRDSRDDGIRPWPKRERHSFSVQATFYMMRWVATS